MKRLFDLVFSIVGLVALSPLLLVISLLIATGSKGGVFFKQERVGKDREIFTLFKFRTMQEGSAKFGLITIGDRDPRVTKIGYFLRKYKLDELPQLLNIVAGHMSFVGPRPEVSKYVLRYSKEQLRVLSVLPGITDFASVKFRNESELLAMSDNPDSLYITSIMPEKLQLNLEYIDNNSVFIDIKIICLTLVAILSKNS